MALAGGRGGPAVSTRRRARSADRGLNPPSGVQDDRAGTGRTAIPSRPGPSSPALARVPRTATVATTATVPDTTHVSCAIDPASGEKWGSEAASVQHEPDPRGATTTLAT